MIDFYLKNFIYQNYNCLEFQPKDPVPVKEKIKFFQNNKIKYVILNKDKILNKSCRFMREYWQENYAPYLYYEDRDIIAYKTY
jgi:hypothetical protein